MTNHAFDTRAYISEYNTQKPGLHGNKNLINDLNINESKIR